MVTFELLTKKKKKIKTKVLGSAAVSGGDATLTVKRQARLEQGDHDRLQRRHGFPGEHADRAQAVEEGAALNLTISFHIISPFQS